MTKTIFNSIFSISLAFLLLTGCTKDIAIQEEANANASEVLSMAPGDDDGTITVSGGGTALEGDAKSTFTFNAVKHKDGSVDGFLLYHFRNGENTTRIDINCLTVVGNKARMAGTVSKVFGQGEIPSFIAEGVSATFAVQDNGEGNAATPDLFSDVFFATGGGTYGCANVNAPGVYIPMSGNITIK
jgi:hypothetical protein